MVDYPDSYRVWVLLYCNGSTGAKAKAVATMGTLGVVVMLSDSSISCFQMDCLC